VIHRNVEILLLLKLLARRFFDKIEIDIFDSRNFTDFYLFHNFLMQMFINLDKNTDFKILLKNSLNLTIFYFIILYKVYFNRSLI